MLEGKYSSVGLKKMEFRIESPLNQNMLQNVYKSVQDISFYCVAELLTLILHVSYLLQSLFSLDTMLQSKRVKNLLNLKVPPNTQHIGS